MVYVLIVLYNSLVKLGQINEIKNNFLVPIIFDNSTNTSIKRKNLEVCYNESIIYESEGKNIGLSRAYNLVIRKYIKDDDWIVLLDSDTSIPSLFYKIAYNVTKTKEYLSFMSIFKYGKNKFGPKIIKDAHLYKTISNKSSESLYGFLIGINSCSIINGKVFKTVGLFNDKLFLDYIDVDFALRLSLYGIKSKSINANLEQHFFSKEKADYNVVKNRLSIQKHDARIFYSSNYLKGFIRKKINYFRDILKFIILYSKTNNIFWFIPLLLVKKRDI